MSGDDVYFGKASDRTSEQLSTYVDAVIHALCDKLGLSVYEVFSVLDMAKTRVMFDLIDFNIKVNKEHAQKKGSNVQDFCGGIKAIKLTGNSVEELIGELEDIFGKIPNYRKGKNDSNVR